jgi:hypothetical protein
MSGHGDYKENKKLAAERDGYKCVICGKAPKNLECHHISPYWQSKDNSLNNLEMLCHSCHKKIHKILQQLRPVKEIRKMYHCPVCNKTLALATVGAGCNRFFCKRCKVYFIKNYDDDLIIREE